MIKTKSNALNFNHKLADTAKNRAHIMFPAYPTSARIKTWLFNFENTDKFTFEMWVNPTELPSAKQGIASVMTKIFHVHQGGFTGWEVFINDQGQFGLNLVDDWETSRISVHTATAAVTVGTWQHIAVTYDGGLKADGVHFYLNGALVDRAEPEADTLNGAFAYKSGVLFGQRRGPVDEPVYEYAGSVACVRIWGAVRSPAEIGKHWERRSLGTEENLLIYYEFAEGTPNADNTAVTQTANLATVAPYAADHDLILYHFALTGTSSNFVEGPALYPAGATPSFALSFDGINDRGNMAFPGYPTTAYVPAWLFNVERTSPFSVEVWLRPNAAAEAAILTRFNQTNTGPSTPGWEIFMTATGHVGLTLSAIWASSRLTVRTSDPFPTDGAWHHLAVTYTGSSDSSGVTIYVDGAAVATYVEVSTLTSGSIQSSKSAMSFGARLDAASNARLVYKGAMGELRFWTVARTAEEVAGAWDKQAAGTESGLAVYYTFENHSPWPTKPSLEKVPNIATSAAKASDHFLLLTNFALTGTTSNFIEGPVLQPSS